MDVSIERARIFVEQVFRIGSWKGELPPATSMTSKGANAMTKLVLGHPAVAGDKRPSLLLRLFGPMGDTELEALRSQSVAFMVAGSIALGMAGQNLKKLVPKLVIAATAIDPESLLLRQLLLRDRPFGPPIPVIPEWLDKLDIFVGRNCYAGVVKALLELGHWASSLSTSDAKGITSLSATTVCSGGKLTIFGSGFGSLQPAGTSVYVPVAGGGCREATVDKWADTEIVVQLPADIGPGCVGFVRFVRGSGSYQGLQRVTGELTMCIGANAQIWTQGFGKIVTPIVSCPPCLPGGQNRLQLAGKPTINVFRFNPSQVEPGGQPVLSWNISNAGNIQIVGLYGSGPILVLPNPIPPISSITLPPIGGLVPVVGRYRITATNGCGTITADAEFTMCRTANLSVTRLEVIQAIQKVDNSVRLTANRRTAVRVFVDSGINDGFDIGFGTNRVGGLVVSLHAESLDNGSVWSCGSPWVPGGEATPTPDRNLLSDSINFDVPLAACHGNMRFRAVVELPGPIGQPPQSWDDKSVVVSFTPKPAQELLPMLIADPSSTSPAPTLADFFVSLSGPSGAQPFPVNGFIINPPISLILSPLENLKNDYVWSVLIARISTMMFLFPTTKVGGIRAGMVPNDSSYPWGGMALPRIAVTVPSFIAQARDKTVCIHELAHTFGLMHMNCGNPAGPFDSRLPLTISDPGIDVLSQTIFPAGTSEAMTYCSPQWPSVEHWDAIFDRIPI
jgi:hypothetical protein